MKGETALQRERQLEIMGNIRQREQIQNETPEESEIKVQMLRE